jgi:hypothetical protein
MKPTTIFITLLIMSFFCASAQDKISNEISMPTGIVNEPTPTAKKSTLNFFVIAKRKKGKIDPATRFNVMRAKIKSFFRPKKFVAIIAHDAAHATDKILTRLKKYDANIGTIWFDSHGMYKKGYALFFIGHDEINYKNIRDSALTCSFSMLTTHSNIETKLIIGSCYGGATYTRCSIDYRDTTRMNGDSLMIALGKFFPQAKIYGSESWVMTKPGIFNANKAAVAGFPKRKLFRDVCYRPAWEHVGKWNEYNAATDSFIHINSVALDSYGNLILPSRSYSDQKVNQEKVSKNLSRLEFDLYK